MPATVSMPPPPPHHAVAAVGTAAAGAVGVSPAELAAAGRQLEQQGEGGSILMSGGWLAGWLGCLPAELPRQQHRAYLGSSTMLV